MSQSPYPETGPNWRERWQPRLPHPSWSDAPARTRAAQRIPAAEFWQRIGL
jgi:hypothetical protein